MAMKVLLVNPPYAALKGATELSEMLGLPYLNAILDKNGFACRYINLEHAKINNSFTDRTHDIYLGNVQKIYNQNLYNDNHAAWQLLIEELKSYKPDIVGISSTTSSHNSAVRVAEFTRRFLAKAKIVYGGPHATAKYNEAINQNVFDFIVRGEGEYTFLELIQTISSDKSYEKVLGLSYKKDSKIIHNKNRSFISDLDVLPSPQKFYQLNSKEAFISIITSRGCNNNCKFCAAPFLWHGLRARSIKNVIEEIKEAISHHKTRLLYFNDANFNYSKNSIMELCQAILDSKLDIKWRCTVNLNIVDEEIVASMKRAGCWQVVGGVEAGDQKVLDAIGKKLEVGQIKDSVKIFNKFGIHCCAFVMYGLPNQSIDSMKQTNRLLKGVNFNDIMYSMFFPIPGSVFYNELKGKIKFDDSRQTFNSSISCFDYHNFNSEFEKVIKDLKKIVIKKRILIKIPFYTTWKFYLKFMFLNPKLVFKKIYWNIKSL